MSPTRRSIGKDPLDWIGEKSPDLLLRESNPRPENGRPLREPAAPGGGVEGAVVRPSRPSTTALTLERQLLLMDGLEPRRRPVLLKPSSRVLLLLILLFAGLGTILLLIQEARGRWNDQVQTLRQTISGLEEERRGSVQVFNDVIREKDKVIREKQGTIQDLLDLQERAAEETRRAWAEARRIQELFQRLMWTPFKPARASAGRGEEPPAAAEGEEPDGRESREAGVEGDEGLSPESPGQPGEEGLNPN